jgi:hypothetical protein
MDWWELALDFLSGLLEDLPWPTRRRRERRRKGK